MKKKIRILIVEDHPLMAQATKGLVEQLEEAEVAGIASTGETALQLAETQEPDIILLDFNLPDMYGDEVAKRVKAKSPNTHIIIFSGFDISDLYNHLIELKVSGIVSKESKGEVVLDLIKSVMKGHTMLPLAAFHQIRFASISKSAEDLLTEDEQHMMEMVVQGCTNEKIAEEIHMSKRSVDNYLKKIYQKFGVKSRAQAIQKFLEKN